MILTPGESVTVDVENNSALIGRVAIHCETHVDGEVYLRLEGVDCELEGEEPGIYYPRPPSATDG